MPGPGRNPTIDPTLRMPPRSRMRLIGEPQRQIRQRPDVEVDHRELIGAIQFGDAAEQSITGIVHEVFDLDALGGERRRDPVSGIRVAEVAGNHDRGNSTRRGDFGRQCIEAIGTPGDQSHPVLVGGKHTGQFGADPGGSTCYQRHQMSHDPHS